MLKSLVVWLTYRCNFRCHYCRERLKKVKTEEDCELWIRSLNTLPPTTIDLTGGEPFLYRGIYEILARIDDKHGLGVTTNLSLVFLDRLPERPDISWTISLHPTQLYKFPLDDFITKAYLIANKYKHVTINYVATPALLKDLPHYYNYFVDRGFRFHVDLDETHTYTEEEKKLLKPYLYGDRVFDAIAGDKLCDAGISHIHILPDGTVRRCYYNDEILGNLFTGFKLYDKPEPCDIPCKAGCDLDKVTIVRREHVQA